MGSRGEAWDFCIVGRTGEEAAEHCRGVEEAVFGGEVVFAQDRGGVDGVADDAEGGEVVEDGAYDWDWGDGAVGEELGVGGFGGAEDGGEEEVEGEGVGADFGDADGEGDGGCELDLVWGVEVPVLLGGVEPDGLAAWECAWDGASEADGAGVVTGAAHDAGVGEFGDGFGDEGMERC